MATKKTTGTELAPIESFSIANRYEGMDPDLLEELQDELADLDNESGIACRLIKIPAGGGLAYEVQGEDDDDVNYEKEITGVIVFTHRMNGFWPGSYGSGESGEDKIPSCSSMDGKTGVRRETGEVFDCERCPLNQFGSTIDDRGNQGKGKACKNMRRLYMMLDGDPNFYLLTVPPTSIKEVNRQLVKIMGSKGIPYTGLIVSLKLEKAVNGNGVAYSKVLLEKKGLLPPAVSGQRDAPPDQGTVPEPGHHAGRLRQRRPGGGSNGHSSCRSGRVHGGRSHRGPGTALQLRDKRGRYLKHGTPPRKAGDNMQIHERTVVMESGGSIRSGRPRPAR